MHQNLLERALKFHREGSFAQAEQLYRDVLNHDPQQPQALRLLGVLHFQRGELPRARQLLEEALRVHPRFPEAYNNLGALWRSQGDWQQALSCYEQALALKPDYPDAYNNLGNLYQERENYPKAVECYQRVLVLSPEDPRAHHNLATTYQRVGRWEEAAAHSRQALKLCPTMAEAHSNYGSLLQRQGRLEEALRCYQQALQINPNLVEVWYNLGGCHQRRGEFTEAEQAFQRVLQLNPHHQSASFQLDALKGRNPPKAPTEYVKELFDDYADTFEQDLVHNLRYGIPNALCSLLPDDYRAELALDLGCGTGLVGEAFQGKYTHLHGMDLSSAMLKKAAEKGCYDRLLEGDIVTLLADYHEEADLVIAADVLIYFGDLVAITHSVKEALKTSGSFLFSVEHGPDGGFELTSAGRYRHGVPYVLRVLEEAGFVLKRQEQVVGRLEKGKESRHDLFLVVKK